MKTETTAAAQLINEAIRAGRLPRRPSMATLNRIAAIVGPVLAQKQTALALMKDIEDAATSNEKKHPTAVA
jgi:hypothetical protein